MWLHSECHTNAACICQSQLLLWDNSSLLPRVSTHQQTPTVSLPSQCQKWVALQTNLESPPVHQTTRHSSTVEAVHSNLHASAGLLQQKYDHAVPSRTHSLHIFLETQIYCYYYYYWSSHQWLNMVKGKDQYRTWKAPKIRWQPPPRTSLPSHYSLTTQSFDATQSEYLHSH